MARKDARFLYIALDTRECAECMERRHADYEAPFREQWGDDS
jgi:hypothetical protein